MTALGVWINQDTPQHLLATDLHRAVIAYDEARSRHRRAAQRWQDAACRIQPRPSCRELRALFFDMQDAESVRDRTFNEWCRAFDAAMGEV